ncbi:type II secretory pathway, component PulD [Coraliomargarita sinensis]|uniref:Type II secretory pathway, component PulD n=1 Tax=Coraliomargarita sinensis TaxID=2174842 RepID=A0A317ZNY8_9BACT|nr:type II secretory pathway, component PulD [Coraliomargarita sinensis]PXA05598.1 type II secretory pathway, component PulD [Coraliomargarita sinensis]
MKQYLIACMRPAAVILVMALAFVALLSPQNVQAQTATDKVRLMADTLRARDSGNLEVAKEKAEELIKIAPQDENVQRLLASINRELDSRSSGGDAASPSVFGQAPEVDVEAAMEMDPKATSTNNVIAAAASEQEARIQAAQAAIGEAKQLAQLGAYGDASNLLDSAAASLTLNTATESTLAAVEEAQANVILMEAKSLADAGDLKGAEDLVEDYRAAGGNKRTADSMARSLDEEISDPYRLDVNEVSPEYTSQNKIIRDLLARGRAQFLNGDYDGAQATFKEVEARDANNAEAKLFQTRIATILGNIHSQNHYKTREQMLTEVDQSWERPKVFDISTIEEVGPINEGLQEKLNKTIIPQVNFSGMELTRVIETLSELSAVYDPEGKGLNIVPIFNPNETNPRVNISLRNLNLDRILQFVTQQVNFSYDVGADAVTIQPSDSSGGVSNTFTEFFPITRATVIRLTGVRGGGGSSGPVDPFSAPAASSSGPSASEETEALQSFFQSAGVNFELTGTSLAFDGEQLIVTQTRRNLERMRTILRNYNEVKQVEIEAKFLEVAQNDLDELGFSWGVGDGARELVGTDGFPILDQFGNPTTEYSRVGTTQGRTLNDTFTTDASTAEINISGLDPIPVAPPTLNTAIDLASGAGNLFSATGWSAAGVDVDLAIRALSRKAGSDLMSAPKVTVLSGKKATITVAQELRYPESYGDIESQVGGGNNNNSVNGNGGGSSISITAGTPQDFVTRNVGVELSVTPNVENDDTISLLLEPRVTEFEGFVEYGGPSVAAISGGLGSQSTVVTVPAGFYQPIFSTREMSTEVTIFDGATLVMGGLTRDEIKSFNDKVPVLGNIPGVGRLFRSEGETRQKRNLLVFVTANLISPGGSPARQNYRNVDANSLFQNPTIMTPSGAANRGIDEVTE